MLKSQQRNASMMKRTTVSIDEDLLADAKSLTEIEETSPLIKAALTALIQRESARRLARMGGSNPNMPYIPRRRSEAVPESEEESSAVQS
jgi:Arc/MetJ family transcription regulator